MRFAGLQPLSLLDFPDLMSCIVFVSGCNLRCPFCHNGSLVKPTEPDSVSEEEVLAYLKKRAGLLDGLVVSGGEPLLYSDLIPFLKKVRQLNYKIKIDTNGTKPALLRQIVEEGLVDYVAMDIKNAPADYPKTVGIAGPDMQSVEESKNYLLSGAVPYEFRTTVVRGLHTRESLCEAARWITGASRYYLQQFKDSGNLLQPEGLGAFGEDEMQTLLETVQAYIPTAALRGI